MTRREWLAVGGLTIASACGRKKGTGYPGYAIIATAGDNSVAAVDLAAFRFVKTIPLAAPPTAVIPSHVPGRAYVLVPSIGAVYVIDENLQPVMNRKLADELSELRLTPDGKRLIAIATNARELVAVDPITLDVLGRRKLSGRPTGLDISVTGLVAVASGGSGTIELFDLASGSRGVAHIDGEIGEVRFRADGKLLLAANLKDRSLTVLNVPGMQAIADLQLAMAPENLCFTVPDGGQLFVSGEGMDAVAIVFPYDTLEVDQTVLAGRNPGVMACSAAPRYLFVGNASGSDVSILDVDTRKAIGVVQVGQRPGYIAITPDDQYALVLGKDSGDLAVIHISAIQKNRAKTGAALFTMLPVGNDPVHAAVVSRVVSRVVSQIVSRQPG